MVNIKLCDFLLKNKLFKSTKSIWTDVGTARMLQNGSKLIKINGN